MSFLSTEGIYSESGLELVTGRRLDRRCATLAFRERTRQGIVSSQAAQSDHDSTTIQPRFRFHLRRHRRDMMFQPYWERLGSTFRLSIHERVDGPRDRAPDRVLASITLDLKFDTPQTFLDLCFRASKDQSARRQRGMGILKLGALDISDGCIMWELSI